ncbi:oxygenase MpaB family protein [Streptomyces sp. NBC_01477]|uniref:oxygenase MpaB family protein n=1 Tax=Streptomyces sp. NBC_01477 TaxID=2976015 RepID=UPI002E36FD9E|nr:oxygenase MpaB family protein [Streptomyces sp. NBC_01477]
MAAYPEIPGLGAIRRRLGAELLARVAGPDGPAQRDRIHGSPGPRWFGPDRPIRAVHGDASMFVGGLRALLLQSLHPLAMAAVAGHSGYRGDPWGRLQRTSAFLAVTTFGTARDAEQAVAHVREIHARVSGTTDDGEPYRASDPHLLGWVHAAEVDSFLRAHRRYGAEPLDDDGYDAYVADAARVAAGLGVQDPPRDQAELAAVLDAYRPELRATPQAREAARFMLLDPPLPWAARPPYAVLAASAVALLPLWSRVPLGVPYLPVVEETGIRLAGHGLTRVIRWAIPKPEPVPRSEPGPSEPEPEPEPGPRKK